MNIRPATNPQASGSSNKSDEASFRDQLHEAIAPFEAQITEYQALIQITVKALQSQIDELQTRLHQHEASRQDAAAKILVIKQNPDENKEQNDLTPEELEKCGLVQQLLTIKQGVEASDIRLRNLEREMYYTMKTTFETLLVANEYKLRSSEENLEKKNKLLLEEQQKLTAAQSQIATLTQSLQQTLHEAKKNQLETDKSKRLQQILHESQKNLQEADKSTIKTLEILLKSTEDSLRYSKEDLEQKNELLLKEQQKLTAAQSQIATLTQSLQQTLHEAKKNEEAALENLQLQSKNAALTSELAAIKQQLKNATSQNRILQRQLDEKKDELNEISTVTVQTMRELKTSSPLPEAKPAGMNANVGSATSETLVSRSNSDILDHDPTDQLDPRIEAWHMLERKIQDQIRHFNQQKKSFFSIGNDKKETRISKAYSRALASLKAIQDNPDNNKENATRIFTYKGFLEHKTKMVDGTYAESIWDALSYHRIGFFGLPQSALQMQEFVSSQKERGISQFSLKK
jgi:hypothetical protein